MTDSLGPAGNDAPPRGQGDRVKRAAADLGDDEIRMELEALTNLWEEVRSDDEGHGGSPGEGIHERMGELEWELKLRAAMREKCGDLRFMWLGAAARWAHGAHYPMTGPTRPIHVILLLAAASGQPAGPLGVYFRSLIMEGVRDAG